MHDTYWPPAYPTPAMSQNNSTGETTSHQSEAGMTLRDYFAAHAPVKAPNWFHHKAPFEVPPIVDFREALRRVEEAEGLDLLEVRNSIINWSIEPTFAMDDPDLNRIGEAAFDIVDESKRKRAAAMEANEAATWFAWRWHYATTMMRMREGA